MIILWYVIIGLLLAFLMLYRPTPSYELAAKAQTEAILEAIEESKR